MLSWILAIGIVLIVVLVVVMTLRSFRRWGQPPPGRGPGADQAESRLEWLTWSQGDQS